jgi:hypothetical protein
MESDENIVKALDEAYQKALAADAQKTWTSGYKNEMTVGERLTIWKALHDLRRKLGLID